MEPVKIPFYAKASLIFIGMFAFISMLYIAQKIILPIIFSVIIAIVMSPLVDFLVRKKFNRVFAIFTALIIVGCVTFSCIFTISTQLSIFGQSFPQFIDKLYLSLDNTVLWIADNSSISAQKCNEFIAYSKNEILNLGKSSIGATISSIGDMIIILVLIPVYVFMFLFYRPLLLDFIRSVFGEVHQVEVNAVLNSTKRIVQQYLIALLFEAIIVAILNTSGLLIIGIDHAIILGIIGALLNIIPYIGGIIAVSLPMIVAYTTKSSPSFALLVLLLYGVIQFIDNNYIIPKLVASKVKINALVSIVVVIAGSALWGIPGMFLSIPLTAIIKVIFDHIEQLKPWGLLLGDTLPKITIFKIKLNYKKS
ncbi:MAG: AI-2E family transporter [Bacteroidota bacterium]